MVIGIVTRRFFEYIRIIANSPQRCNKLTEPLSISNADEVVIMNNMHIVAETRANGLLQTIQRWLRLLDKRISTGQVIISIGIIACILLFTGSIERIPAYKEF